MTQKSSKKTGKISVEHVARLARLELKPKEKRTLNIQLKKILEYFGRIGEVDVGDTEPIYYAREVTNVLREDKPHEFPSEEILNEFPNRRGRYLKAPRIA